MTKASSYYSYGISSSSGEEGWGREGVVHSVSSVFFFFFRGGEEMWTPLSRFRSWIFVSFNHITGRPLNRKKRLFKSPDRITHPGSASLTDLELRFFQESQVVFHCVPNERAGISNKRHSQHITQFLSQPKESFQLF